MSLPSEIPVPTLPLRPYQSLVLLGKNNNKELVEQLKQTVGARSPLYILVNVVGFLKSFRAVSTETEMSLPVIYQVETVLCLSFVENRA